MDEDIKFRDLIKKKYPKTLRGDQCITPCYGAGQEFVHPITFQIVKEDKQVCGIQPHDDFQLGLCAVPTTMNQDEINRELITPYINLDLGFLLSSVYGCKSFEEVLTYIENESHLPIETRMRIVDMGLSVFGKNIIVLDPRFIEFIIKIVEIKYKKYIYKKNNKHIMFEKDVAFFVRKQTTLSKKEHYSERITLMNEKFVNYNMVQTFLLKYFKTRQYDWENIYYPIKDIIISFAEFIEQSIIYSL